MLLFNVIEVTQYVLLRIQKDCCESHNAVTLILPKIEKGTLYLLWMLPIKTPGPQQ